MAAGSIIIDLLLKTGAFETDTKRAEKRWQNFSKEVKDGALAIGGALTAAFAVGKAVPLMDEYSQMASRIRNATQSVQEFNLVQQRLQQSASITYRKISEAGEGFLAFATPMQALGRSTEEVLDLTDSLSFSFTANAARADQAQSAQDALAKSMAKGKVEATAWISILTAADNVAGQVAKTMGVTEAEVRRLGASGQLALNDLINGLIAAKDENRALAENMSASVQDGMTALTNSITVFVGKLNETYGITAKMAGGLVLLGDHIDKVAAAALVFAGVYAGRMVAAQYAVIAARVKDIAAALAQAQANQTAAAAAGTAAAAQFRAAVVGRAALTVFGGWVGLATAAVSIAGGFALLKGASDDVSESLDIQKKSIADLAVEYQKLSDAQRFLKAEAIRKEIDGITDSLKDAQRDLQILMTSGYDAGLTASQLQASEQVWNRFRQNLTDSGGLLRELQATGVFTDSQIARMVEMAQKTEELKQREEEARKALRLTSDAAYRLEEAGKAGKSGAESLADGLKTAAEAAKGASEEVRRFTGSVLQDIAVAAVRLKLLKDGMSEDVAQRTAEFTVKTGQMLDGAAAQTYLKQQQTLEKLNKEAEKYTKNIKEQGKAASKTAHEAAKYVMPYSGSYRITSGIGPRKTGIPGASTWHKGVDVAMPVGTPVKAMADGTIENRIDSKGLKGGFGRYVIIKFDDGTRQVMGYLSKFLAQSGSRVKAGEVVALSGDSGIGRPHLHNEIRDRSNRPVDFRTLVGKNAPGKEQNEVAEKLLQQQQEQARQQQRINDTVADFILRQKEKVALLGKEGEAAKLTAQLSVGLYAEMSAAQKRQMTAAAQAADDAASAFEAAQKYADAVKEWTAPRGIAKFTADIEMLNRALEEGKVTGEQYSAVLDRIAASDPVEIPELKDTAVGSWVKEAQDVAGQVDTAWASMLDNMTSGLTDFITTGKGSFRDFAVEIIKMFAKIAIARAVAGFAASAMGGGGSAPSGWGTNANIANNLFAEGGYTGAGGKYEPAGIVHRGEVVFSQDDVRRFGGVGNVEAMRLRGYATGGVVGLLPTGGRSPMQGNTTINITIHSDGGSESDVRADTETGRQLAAALPALIEQWYLKHVYRENGIYHKKG